ncbi:WYL domain-containing protein [Methylomicrobium sp. Wu6]|uniref:helix-turn-helix transcriptional regulator n=1 Tax=Methylomicrobium sp. Wu6 TaxID=3107928 RepID=UPI002DD681B3|nr:WYL domain-containing protein [Methylomicrobium sp. Wu6]MEC4747652.1 WYL domain-containing protein [Methylomicrobium sp. Wu6]
MQQHLKWEQQQRLTLLEATVFWSGEVSTAALMGNFGISRVQASKDLTTYQGLCPGNIRYDKHKKRYVITEAFTPAFMTGTAAEFLQVLKTNQSQDNGFIVPLIQNLPAVEVLEPVFRKIDRAILQTVNQAIVQRKEIQVRYQSMSNHLPLDYFLSPHTLVFDGLRWHIRAFSQSHGQFRDFVLSRILAAETVGDAVKDRDEDRIWNTYVQAVIAPHPGLTESQRAAIEFDYAMESGELKLRIRAALLNYYLSAIRIGPDDLQRPAHAQQIILANREELKVYLWD